MLGKPKYKMNDRVSFEIDGKTINGYVFIIDEYGTWDNDGVDVSYDIMDDVNKVLYKHIGEHAVRADV